jgi:hypothetical protein
MWISSMSVTEVTVAKRIDFLSVANMKRRSLILMDHVLLSSPNDSSKLSTYDTFVYRQTPTGLSKLCACN